MDDVPEAYGPPASHCEFVRLSLQTWFLSTPCNLVPCFSGQLSAGNSNLFYV